MNVHIHKNRKNWLLGAFAIGFFLCYKLLPPATHDQPILPLVNSSNFSSFTDMYSGGQSTLQLADAPDQIQAQIQFTAPESQAPYVGFRWDLEKAQKKKANWTFMDSIVLDFEAQNISKIQLQLQTFDPDISKPNQPETYKTLIKDIFLDQSDHHHLSVPLESFYIPDWWFKAQQASLKYDSKHFEQVTRIELLLFNSQSSSQPSRFYLTRLTAHGRTNRNLGLLLLGFIVLVMIAIGLKDKSIGNS